MTTLTRERQQDAESAALHASADGLTDELLAAYGDLSAPALFAPMVLDRRAKLMRFQTVSEVMLGQLSGTCDFDSMLELVRDLAYGADDKSVLAGKARTLLKNIAHDFGDVYVTGEFA